MRDITRGSSKLDTDFYWNEGEQSGTQLQQHYFTSIQPKVGDLLGDNTVCSCHKEGFSVHWVFKTTTNTSFVLNLQ